MDMYSKRQQEACDSLNMHSSDIESDLWDATMRQIGPRKLGLCRAIRRVADRCFHNVSNNELEQVKNEVMDL